MIMTAKRERNLGATDEWLVIGVVGAPFGLQGETKVGLKTDFPERFQAGSEVFIRLPRVAAAEPKKLAAVRWHKGTPLVRFEGCLTRSDAERLRGSEVLLPSTERMKLESGRYYIQDLTGMDVWLENGRSLGKIDEVLQYAANDVYVVGTILIPAIKDVVLDVDIGNRRMTIRPMPGLLPEEPDEG